MVWTLPPEFRRVYLLHVFFSSLLGIPLRLPTPSLAKLPVFPFLLRVDYCYSKVRTFLIPSKYSCDSVAIWVLLPLLSLSWIGLSSQICRHYRHKRALKVFTASKKNSRNAVMHRTGDNVSIDCMYIWSQAVHSNSVTVYSLRISTLMRCANWSSLATKVFFGSLIIAKRATGWISGILSYDASHFAEVV